MKTENQHILPQVYLKQFGFKDKGGKWLVCVYEKGNPEIQTKSIKHFLSRDNHYDIPIPIPELEKANEKLINWSFENMYLKLVKDIEVGKPNNDLLVHLIELTINFLCRTDYLRETMNPIFISEGGDSFIDLITVFLEESRRVTVSKIKKLPKECHLNSMMVFVMDHVLEIIKRAKFVITVLRAASDKCWFTSDNPAILIDAFSSEFFFDTQTEVLFPLNKEYLIYIYNPRKDNRFLNLPATNFNNIVEADDIQISKITEVILSHCDRFAIFPCDVRGERLDG